MAKRILIVEDDAALSRLLRINLVHEGFEVECEGPVAAAHQPDFFRVRPSIGRNQPRGLGALRSPVVEPLAGFEEAFDSFRRIFARVIENALFQCDQKGIGRLRLFLLRKSRGAKDREGEGERKEAVHEDVQDR